MDNNYNEITHINFWKQQIKDDIELIRNRFASDMESIWSDTIEPTNNDTQSAEQVKQ